MPDPETTDYARQWSQTVKLSRTEGHDGDYRGPVLIPATLVIWVDDQCRRLARENEDLKAKNIRLWEQIENPEIPAV